MKQQENRKFTEETILIQPFLRSPNAKACLPTGRHWGEEESCFTPKFTFGRFAGQQSSFTNQTRRSSKTKVLERRLAERSGFEPEDPLPGQLLSRQLHSAILPPLQKICETNFLEKPRHPPRRMAGSPLILLVNLLGEFPTFDEVFYSSTTSGSLKKFLLASCVNKTIELLRI